MSTQDLAVTVAALKVANEFTGREYQSRRAELDLELGRGDRVTARDPRDDAKLAAITRTDPKPVVRINEPVFTAWMAAEYPALCETEMQVAPGMEQEVMRVVFEHAPHLLVQRTRVQLDTVNELRQAAVTLRAVVGPGSEAEMPGFQLDIPEPVVTVRLADDAHDRLLSLIKTGQIAIDGTVIRPAIEGAA